MRSVNASARAAVALLILAALPGLAGCSTTQQEAARLQLGSARVRATEQAIRVTKADPMIRVEGVTLLAGRDGTAIVARLRSLSDRILTDLPISVGVIAPHRARKYLNGAVQSDYFDSHVAAIAPGAELTWVFTTPRRLAARQRPFAVVGAPVPGFSSARALPRIAVVERAGAGTGGGAGTAASGLVDLTVHNPTSVPQYGLQVFATVRRGRGYLAAGKTTIGHLGSGASENVHIILLGRATTATPALQATPTIFG